MKSLERHTRNVRDLGLKALVPYFMAGLTSDWTDYVKAAAQGGASAIEIGLPFSDPMMDGVVIQEAGIRSLANGTTIESVLTELATLDIEIPLVVMTYYNVLHHFGVERSVGELRHAGVQGAIIPDLALEESAGWRAIADENDLATVLMIAPSTPPQRAELLAQTTQGFAYASARMAVTGKASSESDGERVVQAIRRGADVPAYIGIGISDPGQAASAALVADGVIVGSALVQSIVDGASPLDIENMIAGFVGAL